MVNTRLFFIDRLRTVLTVLVIAHHSAITYGGSGGWFYREVPDGVAPLNLVLTLFCAVNQAFFMGLFFLLAGYFTPPVLAAKGVRRFVQDRLLRLGVPLLAFGLVLGPLAMSLAGAPLGQSVGERWLALMGRGAFIIGPLWFAWALLIFSAGALVWRVWQPAPNAQAAPAPVPGDSVWLAAALGVGAVALALRQGVPVGQNVAGLQLGYFASYVFLFALGCGAWRHRWLERVPPTQARRWGRVARYTVPVLVLTALLTGALQGKAVNFNGGLGLAAVVYAFWEPLVAWGLIARLLVVFQARFNTPSPHWQRWGAQAYGAFVLHAPVIVALAVGMAGWPLHPGLKFVLLVSGGTVLSFWLAGLLRRVPGMARVL